MKSNISDKLDELEFIKNDRKKSELYKKIDNLSKRFNRELEEIKELLISDYVKSITENLIKDENNNFLSKIKEDISIIDTDKFVESDEFIKIEEFPSEVKSTKYSIHLKSSDIGDIPIDSNFKIKFDLQNNETHELNIFYKNKNDDNYYIFSTIESEVYKNDFFNKLFPKSENYKEQIFKKENIKVSIINNNNMENIEYNSLRFK